MMHKRGEKAARRATAAGVGASMGSSLGRLFSRVVLFGKDLPGKGFPAGLAFGVFGAIVGLAISGLTDPNESDRPGN